ncbi:hypothetical protein C0989_005139, partial [Termitomyces sp. Mn162]
TLVIPIRAQNACVVIRRLETSTIYESFEIDPPNEQVMATKGRLVRLFPGPAFELADSASTSAFQRELSSFLADMDVVDVGSAAFTTKAGSDVFEARDTADPHYITQLLSSILHGWPQSVPANVERIKSELRKISDTVPDALLSRATEAIGKVKEIVEKRWQDIQSHQALSPPWLPKSLDVVQDTVVSLLSSKDYLFTRLQQHDTPIARHKFKPPKAPRLTVDDFLHPKVISGALSREPLVALADVERFAVRCLEAWVDKHRSNPLACSAIGECITYYADSARTHYKDNPEDQSLMFLTIFLLWSALDRLAIIHLPLLEDYSPEVPDTILNPILLRKSEHIQSLISFRNYLHTRHSRAQHGSIFSDRISESSFAIRYFLDSSTLQRLKRKIETKAKTERQAKQQEFASLQAKYKQLTEEAKPLNHHHPQRKDKSTCKKCSLTGKAASLKIQVHEWPLPEETLSAKATVFELQCPPVLQAWRSTTYAILYDFCRPRLSVERKSSKSPKAEMNLADYVGLKDYYTGRTRITYASTTKPFMKAHYSKQKIANIDLSSVLVNNGMCYRLFDTKLNRWVAGSFADSSVNSLCKFVLPTSSPYYSLQYAMQGTTHSPNQPLAEQAGVPPELNVHDYIAFGTLRSGGMIQWFNILRVLRARTLSFDRLEVHMLLIQAAMETGNLEGQELEWHRVLQQSDFGVALLSEIDELLSSIENNWHHIVTLQTMVILTSRLLACAEDEEVVDRACSTLRAARAIAFSWVDQLAHDLDDTKDSEPQNEDTSNLIRQRVCLAAATCRTTYDVDSCYFDRLIISDEDINIFIQCAIRIRDNTGPNTSMANVPLVELSLFLARDRRLSQELASTVWMRCQTSRTGIDSSILAVWPDYRPGSEWRQLPEGKERWLTSTMSRASGSLESRVHYNILDGSLLIDGKPHGRLPSSIIGHPIYVRLLGDVRALKSNISMNSMLTETPENT